MGKVAAVYNVIPENPEVPPEKIVAEIPRRVPPGVTINNMTVKPFAFGLKIIEVTAIMDDAEGLIEKLEESLRAVPEVQGVDSVTVTLI